MAAIATTVTGTTPLGRTVRALGLGALGLGLGLGAVQPQATAQDYTTTPLYGSVSLRSGFTPDPYTIPVMAGGRTDARTLGLGADCVGFIETSQPDFRVQYQAGTIFPLSFGVTSNADTTLIISGPDGRWYCNDDFGNSFDPLVIFSTPRSGQYDIWIGTFSSGSPQPATLFVTEF